MPRVVEEALPKKITPKMRAYTRAILAEGVATFFFVAAVLSAIINQGRSSVPAVNLPIGVGIVAGLAGTATCFAFGDISGAHFNPGITFGFLLARKIGIFKGISYIVAQLLGGIVAAGLTYSWFPADLEGFPSVSSLIPAQVPSDVPAWNAFFMEVYLTFNLVYVVFATAVDAILPPDLVRVDQHFAEIKHEYKSEAVGLSDGVILAPEEEDAVVEDGAHDEENPEAVSRRKESQLAETQAREKPFKDDILVFVQPGANKKNFAPIAIGFTIGFNAFLGSSSSGGAFNPARVFGAALFSGNWNNGWLYYVGPILGSFIAVIIHQLILARKGALLSPPKTE